MAMHDPPHPGGIVRRQFLEPLGLSVTQAAKHLGVARQSLSELVNGRGGVSVDWEIRLGGRDGIARALYVTVRGQRVVVVRAFVKKTQRTPRREIEVALRRAREVLQ